MSVQVDPLCLWFDSLSAWWSLITDLFPFVLTCGKTGDLVPAFASVKSRGTVSLMSQPPALGRDPAACCSCPLSSSSARFSILLISDCYAGSSCGWRVPKLFPVPLEGGFGMLSMRHFCGQHTLRLVLTHLSALEVAACLQHALSEP